MSHTPATRVFASVGRTCCGPGVLRRVIEAGARGFRLALGLHDRDHTADLRAVRDASAATGIPVETLADLPASRPRTGRMPDRSFVPGTRVSVVDACEAYSGDVVPLPKLARFLPALNEGHRLLFRDGRQVFRVTGVHDMGADAICEACAEPLQSGNACSFPDSAVRFEPLRDEDRHWLAGIAAAGLRLDWVALSLVTTPEQVRDARAALATLWTAPPRVMAKVETAAALDRLAPILHEADGLLLGRGDLGLAIPPERLPAAQRNLAEAANAAGKPWLVATQILERFAATGAPYRAELTDVAVAARQGAAGVLLCQETNDSPRPVETVALACRVLAAEASPGG
jgi:pyruvate kinase